MVSPRHRAGANRVLLGPEGRPAWGEGRSRAEWYCSEVMTAEPDAQASWVSGGHAGARITPSGKEKHVASKPSLREGLPQPRCDPWLQET